MEITGHFTDIFQQRVFPASMTIEGGKVAAIRELPDSALPPHAPYILPGFVDAHVHIESSMLVPAEFARLAVVHGTVATVSDPHEIANVCGMDGVQFMIENGKQVPFKFNFGAPSCVPATTFETAGSAITADDVALLLQRPDIRYLSEMMNYPGVLMNDPDVMKKISFARSCNKPVDGHAPGLRGRDAQVYIDAGISTDHECFTAEEALDKLMRGMKIIIREGSAARNFDALAPLLHEHSEHMMFCSDDKHPDSLVEGHINQLCQRAIAMGIDRFRVLRAACINPVLHYGLPVGLLRAGDAADFILVEDLESFRVIRTFIDGSPVADLGVSLLASVQASPVNRFSCSRKTAADFAISRESYPGDGKNLLLIEAQDGQLITNKGYFQPGNDSEVLHADPDRDILKIVVVNRYHDAPAAIAFVRNFGLKAGAIASSVAHDSHNLVAVGVDDESISRAINLVIDQTGGVSCVGPDVEEIVPLPVGGLMSMEDGYKVAQAYTRIDAAAKGMGASLVSPFMTLSFMALLVIPHLKLSDKGLFDGDAFRLLT